ncbi:MAG: extracellular solute-binding protein [Nitrospiraceae bacterium]|nr:MAG: extracellular solute-binding protein [Nitrospiraceae bacterium]
MKKILACMLIGILLLTLFAGCGGGKSFGTEDKEPAKAEQSTQNEETKNADQDTGKPVELAMTSWRTEDAEGWAKINEAFNKQYPNIKVKFNPVKNTEYDSYLQAALTSGKAEEIIMVRSFDAGKRLYDGGYLVELNEAVIPNLKDMPASTKMPFSTEDGKIYAAPEGLVYLGFLYNKKIFESNNLNKPETWDEFFKACEVLKSKGIIPIAQGAKDSWTLEELLSGPIIMPFVGGEEWKQKLIKGETDFLDAGFVKHLEVINKLKDYFPEGYEGIGYTDQQQMFISEQAAIYPSGSFETFYLKKMNPDLDFGCFATPVQNKGDKRWLNANVSFGYGINKNCKNMDAANTYVNWLVSAEGAQMLGDTVVGFYSRHPEVRGVADEQASEWLTYLSPQSDNVMITWTYQYLKKQQPDVGTLTSEAVSKMWIGDYTPQQAAQHIQDGMKWFFDSIKK